MSEVLARVPEWDAFSVIAPIVLGIVIVIVGKIVEWRETRKGKR